MVGEDLLRVLLAQGKSSRKLQLRAYGGGGGGCSLQPSYVEEKKDRERKMFHDWGWGGDLNSVRGLPMLAPL